MKFLVIVVTYKSRDMLDGLGQLLGDILASEPTSFCVSIENSGDRETGRVFSSMLSASRDRYTHLDAVTNIGFAPAVNHAFLEAVRRWGDMHAVLLLNPDIVASAEVVSTLIRALGEDSSIGIVSPKLVDSDGRTDRGSARRRWTRLSLWAEVAGLGLVWAAHVGTRSRYATIGQGPTDVDITSGALMAIRATVFAGGLDERLPMYLEDQEVCHRAHRMGYRVVVLPQPEVLHLGGVSRSRNTNSQRNLRCMELAVAPSMSLMDWTGVSHTSTRVVIGLGGLTRLLLAVGSIAIPGRRQWARDQLTLGYWFIRWSMSPNRWGQRL